MIRLLLATVAVFALLSCSSSEDPVGDKDLVPDDRGLAMEELPQSSKLAGRTVEVAEEGPWTIRRTAGSDRREGREGKGRSLVVSGGVAPGAADSAPEKITSLRPMDAPAMDADPGDSGTGGGDSEGHGPPPTGGAVAESEESGGFAEPSNNASPLRAGTTDDNEEYDAFLTFLAKWGDRESTVGRYQMLDVADRKYIRVTNKDGSPIPGAEVRVVDEAADRILLSGTTYGDGRVPFYPHLEDRPGETVPASVSEGGNLIVQVSRGTARRQLRWDGGSPELSVTLDIAQPVEGPIALDVVFLIDTTGSMGDEIGRIKASLLSMTVKLRSLEREFDLRYGGVLYRDIGDAYVTKAHPFTGDIEAFDAALQSIRANGGGDGPESLNQGLAEAVGRMDWRSGAAKVVFLIADAPPHMDYKGDIFYGESLKAALARGIRIHAVAASGIDEVGSLVFRQVAQFTRGKFIFIEYGSIESSAASHGVAGEVKSNNLDDILFERIREEVARWGR